jgi:hypothetical protein
MLLILKSFLCIKRLHMSSNKEKQIFIFCFHGKEKDYMKSIFLHIFGKSDSSIVTTGKF